MLCSKSGVKIYPTLVIQGLTVLEMPSEKRGVKIDPTFGLQWLSVLYEIAYYMHACFWAFWLSYPYTTYYSLKEIVSRAPRSLIFAFQWLHSAYSYTVTQCVPVIGFPGP